MPSASAANRIVFDVFIFASMVLPAAHAIHGLEQNDRVCKLKSRIREADLCLISTGDVMRDANAGAQVTTDYQKGVRKHCARPSKLNLSLYISAECAPSRPS